MDLREDQEGQTFCILRRKNKLAIHNLSHCIGDKDSTMGKNHDLYPPWCLYVLLWECMLEV